MATSFATGRKSKIHLIRESAVGRGKCSWCAIEILLAATGLTRLSGRRRGQCMSGYEKWLSKPICCPCGYPRCMRRGYFLNTAFKA